jgi:membrane-associated phospholipid phosphatase
VNTPLKTEPQPVAGPPTRDAWRWRAATLPAAALLALAITAGVDPMVAAWAHEGALRRWFETRFFPSTDVFALLANLLAIWGGLPRRWRPTARTPAALAGFALAFVAHLPMVHALKWLLGRARPLAALGAYHFAPCGGLPYHDSFPSAHTSAAATMAFLLALWFPRWRVAFYIWIALEGLKRIVLEWHYLSDVLAGVLLAWLIVHAAARIGPPWFPATRRAPRVRVP